jgi:hypothetical protein
LNYVDEVAEAIRRLVAPELVPEGDTAALFRTYAVLVMAKGEAVEMEDVHDAWAAWMSEQDPAHASLKPLYELSPDVQHADEPYWDAIQAVARSRRQAQIDRNAPNRPAPR